MASAYNYKQVCINLVMPTIITLAIKGNARLLTFCHGLNNPDVDRTSIFNGCKLLLLVCRKWIFDLYGSDITLVGTFHSRKSKATVFEGKTLLLQWKLNVCSLNFLHSKYRICCH